MNPIQVFFLRISGAVGALAVVTGAFGAHGLESRLTTETLETWEIAVRYHFYHVIPMFALACAPADLWKKRAAALANGLFLAGIVLFSGSLYLLALTDVSWLGAVTPIGGVAFIAGWIAAAYAVVPKR